MSCTFCGAARPSSGAGSRSSIHMQMETLQKILQNIPMIRWIDLQGVGEPLVHPQFSEILKLLQYRGISVQFTTNGILLNNRVIKDLSGGNVHSITISLSASGARKYFEIHGSNLFFDVLENTRRLVKTKKNGRPKIRILAVVMSDNLHELRGLVEVAKSLGVDSLVLSAYKKICDNDRNEPDHRELSKAINDASKYAITIGMPLDIEVPIADMPLVACTGVSFRRCLWPWTGLAVSVNGDVTPCCYSMGNKKFELGNLAHENIYDIFNNHGYRKLRASLNVGNTEGLACHICNDYVG